MAGIVDTLTNIFNFVLSQNFLGGDLGVVLYFLIFGLSVYLIYRSLKLALKGGLVFAASGLFPVVANHFFGLGIPITFDSILSYATTGLVVYLILHFFKSVYAIIKIATWPFRKLFGTSEEEKIERKVKKDLEEE